MKRRLFLLIGLSAMSMSLHAQAEADDMPKPSTTVADTVMYDSVFRKVDVQASWAGGDAGFIQFVQDHFEYPTRCWEEGIGGYVLLRFVVDTAGRLTNFRIVETTESCPEFAQEAIRVMKMSPRWIPALYLGKKVVAYRQVPIRLSID